MGCGIMALFSAWLDMLVVLALRLPSQSFQASAICNTADIARSRTVFPKLPGLDVVNVGHRT
jgi:hypothetical protein